MSAPALPWAPDVVPTADELDWYEIGYLRGRDDERADAEAEDAAAWALMRHAIRRTAASPTHADLIERRARVEYSSPALAQAAAKLEAVRVIAGPEAVSRVCLASWDGLVNA